MALQHEEYRRQIEAVKAEARLNDAVDTTPPTDAQEAARVVASAVAFAETALSSVAQSRGSSAASSASASFSAAGDGPTPTTGARLKPILRAVSSEITSGRQVLPPLYDVICMDHVMPTMGGPEAVAELRSMGHHGMVIGITGNSSASDVAHFESQGASCVLSKPLNMEDFNQAIRDFALALGSD